MANTDKRREDLADAINILSSFLANEEITNLNTCATVDCIVICVSALVFQGERLFQALEQRPSLTKTLVLVGGLGHSTGLLYKAVGRDGKYKALVGKIQGLPEARVMEMILETYSDMGKIRSSGCRVLIEDRSTNCGSNAVETRKVLEAADIPTPKTVILIQDPTMSLRSLASFQKTYEDHANPPNFLCCPLFVPTVQPSSTGFNFANEISHERLWSMYRFLELILGEIPRLRDDEHGYGPAGKGFIPHVDIPEQVEHSWRLLKSKAHDNAMGRSL